MNEEIKTSIEKSESKELELSSDSSSESNNELFFVKSNTELTKDNEKSKREEGPNLDVFLAKSSKSIEPNKINMKPPTNGNIAQIIKLLLIWLSPGLCIFSLHISMEDPTSLSISAVLDFQQNFNTTQANSEMLKLLNSPPNVTTHERSNEINNIVKNVYKIVEKVSERSQTKGDSSNNLMYDIVHFLNQKFNPKNDQDKCSFNTSALKIHSFILFFIMYFASILYTKILQLKIKLDGNENANLIKIYILLFGLLWMPCVLELFSRIYVFNEKSSTTAATTLSLGNLFVVFNNLNNYLLHKM
ncbi:hypothetical protein HHI36_006699 [Cryptolaemus montrouzieri]|uniref:Uncharacterized protein n=1 Tax=Cryptolaemus montrouzieri TaxID=559131 RepID=A0ABD2NXY7_9CUCU